ncbi:MAG: methyltransferase domain-containing protein [Acidimicrobiales bacterium]|jgi:ubiquinone/menaquinone biosynthesis C-methylase UbiE|nr:methyltransferase domain-containing protein [Acidimicrobiales bacterium]
MSDERIPRAAAEGFDRGADVYEASRPSYPADAVARIESVAGLGPGRTVVDLAAGTGKLTRLLLGSGAEVVAVEPLAEMRRVLVEACGGRVEVLDGVAEDIPLDDASADAVIVAQAFHWFEPRAALAEMARVLRPGGTLVLVWNTRDRSHDWVERFGDLLAETVDDRPYDSYYEVDYAGVVAASGAFGDVDLWETTWSQTFDAELLVARAASVSVVAALDDDDRARVLDRVRRLAATHPDLAGRSTFPFPYTTRVYTCRRR